MDIYNLSRKWFDFCFENPEKIKPNHTALYFFCIEQCNRLGWKEKFGLPTTMAKEAIGIHSYNTYIKTLNDLIEFGFIKLIQKSKNQYSSNIVALSNFDKPQGKTKDKTGNSALSNFDKAIIKHATKQRESTRQSTSSIDIQYTNIPIDERERSKNNGINDVYPFDEFWNDYDKKVGSKDKLRKKWNRIPDPEKVKIKEYIPKYKASTPDKQFRKNPETFINNESWKDEIIYTDVNRKGNETGNRKNKPFFD